VPVYFQYSQDYTDLYGDKILPTRIQFYWKISFFNLDKLMNICKIDISDSDSKLNMSIIKFSQQIK
jgi:hypothetical protein